MRIFYFLSVFSSLYPNPRYQHPFALFIWYYPLPESLPLKPDPYHHTSGQRTLKLYNDLDKPQSALTITHVAPYSLHLMRCFRDISLFLQLLHYNERMDHVAHTARAVLSQSTEI